MKILITIGVPGCGKTTWAKNFQEENPSSVIIERDDIRKSYYHEGFEWSQELEDFVTQYQNDRIVEHLKNRDVEYIIISDTNLNKKSRNRIYNIASQFDVEVEEVVFHTSLSECLENNQNRPEEDIVPKHIISTMYFKKVAQYPLQHDFDAGESFAYIFDIDGTLATKDDRGIFDYNKVDRDYVNQEIAEVCRALYNAGYTIIIMSGRENYCRALTEQWLNYHSIPYHEIYMRSTGDHRKDFLVKYELFHENIEGRFSVRGIFDDRKQVVDTWRAMNIRTFAVAEGNF